MKLKQKNKAQIVLSLVLGLSLALPSAVAFAAADDDRDRELNRIGSIERDLDSKQDDLDEVVEEIADLEEELEELRENAPDAPEVGAKEAAIARLEEERAAPLREEVRLLTRLHSQEVLLRDKHAPNTGAYDLLLSAERGERADEAAIRARRYTGAADNNRGTAEVDRGHANGQTGSKRYELNVIRQLYDSISENDDGSFQAMGRQDGAYRRLGAGYRAQATAALDGLVAGEAHHARWDFSRERIVPLRDEEGRVIGHLSRSLGEITSDAARGSDLDRTTGMGLPSSVKDFARGLNEVIAKLNTEVDGMVLAMDIKEVDAALARMGLDEQLACQNYDDHNIMGLYDELDLRTEKRDILEVMLAQLDVEPAIDGRDALLPGAIEEAGRIAGVDSLSDRSKELEKVLKEAQEADTATAREALVQVLRYELIESRVEIDHLLDCEAHFIASQGRDLEGYARVSQRAEPLSLEGIVRADIDPESVGTILGRVRRAN